VESPNILRPIRLPRRDRHTRDLDGVERWIQRAEEFVKPPNRPHSESLIEMLSVCQPIPGRSPNESRKRVVISEEERSSTYQLPLQESSPDSLSAVVGIHTPDEEGPFQTLTAGVVPHSTPPHDSIVDHRQPNVVAGIEVRVVKYLVDLFSRSDERFPIMDLCFAYQRVDPVGVGRYRGPEADGGHGEQAYWARDISRRASASLGLFPDRH
jgi:hypothetical protein